MRELHKLSIRVGCPPSIFWDDYPSLFWDYVDVYVEDRKLKAEEKMQYMDYEAWLQGSYMVHALSNFGIMVKKPQAYPSEPFYKSRQDKEKEATQPKEKTVEQQQNELIAALMSYNQRK